MKRVKMEALGYPVLVQRKSTLIYKCTYWRVAFSNESPCSGVAQNGKIKENRRNLWGRSCALNFYALFLVS